jgi:hypothetical protein
MDLHEIHTMPGTTQEELKRLQEGILAMAEPKHYTWEEKIESLVKLAKAAGRYVNAEPGTDYCAEAYEKLKETYEQFCQWRHDEPYVVDEIKTLLGESHERHL